MKNKIPKPVSLGELMCMAEVKPRRKACKKRGREIYIGHNDGRDYSIHTSRCDTKEKILEWVLHLSHKSWVTRWMIIDFIEIACAEHNLNPWIGA